MSKKNICGMDPGKVLQSFGRKQCHDSANQPASWRAHVCMQIAALRLFEFQHAPKPITSDFEPVMRTTRQGLSSLTSSVARKIIVCRPVSTALELRERSGS